MEKKKDILTEVLTGADQGNFPGLDEMSRLLTQTARPARQKTIHQGGGGKSEDAARPLKKKTTHYLSPETFEGISRTLPEIVRNIPEGARKRFSKSKLVDASVNLLLRDFAEKGKESLIIRYFLNK
jgi:hypothetical protein